MSGRKKPVGMDVIKDDNFSLDGFQLVREEFFAQIYEPSITFVDHTVYVNTACLRMLPENDYIQILVNPDEKKLAVRPCSHSAKNSLRWCSATEKRSPRHLRCRIFYAKVYSLMGWNTKDKYKLIGKPIESKNSLIFVFDLNSPKVTIRSTNDTGKITSSKETYYPAGWQNQFGLPVAECDGQLMIDIFEDKAVFNLEKDPANANKEEIIAQIQKESEVTENEQLSLLESGLQAGSDNRPEEKQAADLQTDPTPAG